MIRLVTVKFRDAGRQYDFNAQNFRFHRGDKVIVETDRGRALATVVVPPRDIPPEEAPEKLKSVLRPATQDDLTMSSGNSAREEDAQRYCQKRIQERGMDMKLVRAEYLFDGSKIIFYFTADGRIDFRELVKDLAHHFHTRIEMRQIGVRDEAKMIGGLGVCGRELCCCSFLTEFSPVSVKMAKEQGLALNPGKISGQCGRLLCCLGYEYETYSEMRKGLPKCGRKLQWDGQDATVIDVNILQQTITISLADGNRVTLTSDEFTAGRSHPCRKGDKEGGHDCARQSDQSTAPRPARPDDRSEEQDQRGDGNQRRRNRNRRNRNRRSEDGGGAEQGESNRTAPDKPAPPTEQGEQSAASPDRKKRPRRRSRRRGRGGKPESGDNK